MMNLSRSAPEATSTVATAKMACLLEKPSFPYSDITNTVAPVLASDPESDFIRLNELKRRLSYGPPTQLDTQQLLSSTTGYTHVALDH